MMVVENSKGMDNPIGSEVREYRFKNMPPLKLNENDVMMAPPSCY